MYSLIQMRAMQGKFIKNPPYNAHEYGADTAKPMA